MTVILLMTAQHFSSNILRSQNLHLEYLHSQSEKYIVDTSRGRHGIRQKEGLSDPCNVISRVGSVTMQSPNCRLEIVQATDRTTAIPDWVWRRSNWILLLIFEDPLLGRKR